MQRLDRNWLISAVAIMVAVASVGIFHGHQDLCVVAVSQGYTAIVRCMFLIGSCSHVHPGTTTTLLMTAVQYGHHHTAKFLLDSGADVDATDKAGRTALHHAARDDTSLVELLIQAGADVQAPDRDGFTPLMTAALHGRQAVVERLLPSGADVNALSRFRDSALSLSADRGDSGVVALLLEHKADVNVRDVKGQTPFVKTISGGHVAVTALLLGRRDLNIDNLEYWMETTRKKKRHYLNEILAKRNEEDQLRRTTDVCKEKYEICVIDLQEAWDSARNRGKGSSSWNYGERKSCWINNVSDYLCQMFS